jgi:hypothetical protein
MPRPDPDRLKRLARKITDDLFVQGHQKQTNLDVEVLSKRMVFNQILRHLREAEKEKP